MKVHTVLHTLAPAARRTSFVLALGGALLAAPLLAQEPAAPGPPPPPPAQQQDHDGMHGRHHKQMEHMKKELNLTDDQVQQIKQIRQQDMQQMQTLHSDTTVSQEDRRSKMMDMRKDENDKIRAVLNDDQKEKFDKMVAKQHERREDRREERNENPAPPAAPAAPPSL